MSEITAKGNSPLYYKLQIDPQNYESDQFPAIKNAFRKEITWVEAEEPAKIDSARLMRVLGRLRVRDYKYYYFMLDKMVRNDIAIHCSHIEMRDTLGDNKVETVAQAIQRLIQVGLIFNAPKKRGCYIINPLYAWKGNRFEYLNIESIAV